MSVIIVTMGLLWGGYMFLPVYEDLSERELGS